MTNSSDNQTSNSNKASVFKHPMMAETEENQQELGPKKKLSKWGVVKQAFSLLWALQDMKKFKQATDQFEENMAPVILAGIISMILFMSICITAANLALYFAGV
jgi:hypothetical protein